MVTRWRRGVSEPRHAVDSDKQGNTVSFFSRARATKSLVPSGKPTTTTPSTAPAAHPAVEVRGTGGRESR